MPTICEGMGKMEGDWFSARGKREVRENDGVKRQDSGHVAKGEVDGDRESCSTHDESNY